MIPLQLVPFEGLVLLPFLAPVSVVLSVLTDLLISIFFALASTSPAALSLSTVPAQPILLNLV